MSEPPIEPDEDEALPTIDGWAEAEISGDRINVFDSPIIAGDPAGARIEIRSTGFHAFNGTGIETAHIDGAEGVFVGGEFRTSDTLPGQVALSDTANQGSPGISIEPEDDTGYDVLPSIGPGPDHMSISGGVSTAGAMSGAQFSANGTNIYHNGPGANGTGSWAAVGDGEAGLRYRPDRTNALYESAIRARADDAVVYSGGPNGSGFLSASPLGTLLDHVGPGDSIARAYSRAKADPEYLMLERKIPGVTDRHRLILDDDGVWVQTVFGASPVSYNLLETAQDSGWQPFTVSAGITGSADLAWRNKGGVIWFRGNVSGSWASGYQYLTGVLPGGMRPQERVETMAVSREDAAMMVRVHPSGRLDLWKPSAGSATIYLSGVSYPLG